MQSHIASYKQQGYQPISTNNSCIGAEVLFHSELNKVVKFGQDCAYDVFVKHAMAFPSPAFPRFFHHDTPAGPFATNSNKPYTVTEMEHLSELTVEEGTALLNWFGEMISAFKNGSDPNAIADPFQLTPTLLELKKVAVGASVGLDMQKTTNYMARNLNGRREIVITDPFN